MTEKTQCPEAFAWNNSPPNNVEKAAEKLLGYQSDELPLLRQHFVDEFCDKKEEHAFLKPEKLALRLALEDTWYQCQDCARLVWCPLQRQMPQSAL